MISLRQRRIVCWPDVLFSVEESLKRALVMMWEVGLGDEIVWQLEVLDDKKNAPILPSIPQIASPQWQWDWMNSRNTPSDEIFDHHHDEVKRA